MKKLPKEVKVLVCPHCRPVVLNGPRNRECYKCGKPLAGAVVSTYDCEANDPLTRAQEIVDAWIHFTGLSELLKKKEPMFAQRLATIALKAVTTRCASTMKSDLSSHINGIVEHADLSKVRLDPKSIKPIDTCKDPAEVRKTYLRKELTKLYEPIAGRRQGWTLLSIEYVESLKRALESGLPNDAPEIIKDGCISVFQLDQLVMRRLAHAGPRTAAANNRSKEQRSEAARRGHDKKQSNKLDSM